MATRTVYLPQALPHQLPVLLSPARQKLVVCGRRWGKTGTGLMATVMGHGPHRTAMAGAIDGATIWWVAPTFTIASIIWRQLKRATKDAWTEKSETEHRIDLPGSGSIKVCSADNPDSLRGEGLDGLVIDEAAFLDKEAWTASLRPALSDKQGWCMKLTTPNGYNWIKEEFDAAPGRTDWEAWQRPSSDNPLIGAEELREAELDMGPRAFAQEHLAQFCDTANAEFPGEYFRESIWFDEWPPLDSFAFRVMTLDPSKGKTDRSDYSAFILAGVARNGAIFMDADLSRRDVRQIVRDGIELARGFDPHAVGVESNQFQEVLADNFAEAARESGYMLPIHCFDNRLNKVTRIRATLTPFLSRGEIRVRRSRGGRLLVQQLRDFPCGDHDDGPDAAEMAIRLLKQLYIQGGQDPAVEEIGFEPIFSP
jgi:predicted phage terminase large subunit-like protein